MSQNRDAPAFQEYPAEMLSKLYFRELTLLERGLLYTLRLECWVNQRLPADPLALARILGLNVEDVVGAMPVLHSFFEVAEGVLRCPELDDYRAHLETRKTKQSEGGKRGSAITNKKRGRSKKPADTGDSSTSSSTPTTDPRISRRGQVESLVQQSQVQPSQEKQHSRSVAVDPFVADYVAAEERETSKRTRVVI